MYYKVNFASNDQRGVRPFFYKNPIGWTEMYSPNAKEGDIIPLSFTDKILKNIPHYAKFPKYPYIIDKIEHRTETNEKGEIVDKNEMWVHYSGDLDSSVFETF